MSNCSVGSQPLASSVRVCHGKLIVRLMDGRCVAVPLEWFPRLLQASGPARRGCQLMGNGAVIYWPDLGECIKVPDLLRGKATGWIPFQVPESAHSLLLTEAIRDLVGEELPTCRLFHYTTLEGLKGIVGSCNIWASDLGFLNDPEEIKYGLCKIQGYVKRRLGNFSIGIERNVHDAIMGAADIGKVSTKGKFSRFFAFSLSEAEDNLGQWRGYGPNGDGVSIGFDHEVIARRASEQFFKFIKCRYEPEEQEALISAFVDRALTHLKDGNPVDSAYNSWINPGVQVLAFMFKRKAFDAEKEWRLVIGPQPLNCSDDAFCNTRFRMRNRELIPYIEFGLDSDDDQFPINHVRIGPGPNSELKELAVRGLVTKVASPIKVELSSITLRST